MVHFLTSPILGCISRRQWRERCKCNIRYTINSSNSTVTLDCLRCCRGWDGCIIQWVKCSCLGSLPRIRRLCGVQNAASRSFTPQQQEVLTGACKRSHGPFVLSAGNAVPRPVTALTLPCQCRSHWEKRRAARNAELLQPHLCSTEVFGSLLKNEGFTWFLSIWVSGTQWHFPAQGERKGPSYYCI